MNARQFLNKYRAHIAISLLFGGVVVFLTSNMMSGLDNDNFETIMLTLYNQTHVDSMTCQQVTDAYELSKTYHDVVEQRLHEIALEKGCDLG